MSMLENKLNKKWAEKVISEDNKLILAIIHDLQEKGREIAGELGEKEYESMEWLFEDHEKGKDPFDKLEGKAERDGNVMVLKSCPMSKLLGEVMVDGKLPEFYQRIVDKYKEIYKTKGAILHPFCIVHQVIRAMVGEHIKIGGKKLKVYQIACRSMTSGKIVYASEGMNRVSMSKVDIDKKIEGKACMYLIKP
jgi:hypothetical protein